MNLSEIVAGVGYALSHEPKSDNERRQRKRIVNEVYEDLINSAQWEFLEKIQTPLWLYPELNILDGTAVVDEYKYTFSGTVPLPQEFLGGTLQAFTADDAKCFPEATNIVKIEGADVFTSKPCSVTASERVVVRQRVQMPADLGEPLGLVSRIRQQGPIPHLDHAEEQHIMLYDTYRGTWPQAWLIDPPDTIDAAPVDTPTAELSSGASGSHTLKSNTKYRFFYAWYTQGRLTGHSGIVSITTGVVAPEDDIILTGNFLDESVRGIENRLYVEESDSGTFVRAVPSVPFSGSNAVTWQGEVVADEPWRNRGPYRFLRVWPAPVTLAVDDPVNDWPDLQTQSTGIPLEFRYLFRPPAMVQDTDVPLLPIEHHRLLVHLATERLAAKRDDAGLVMYHGKQAKEMVGRMRKRYLTEAAANYRFRMWTHSLQSSRHNRPSITRKP